MAEPIRTAPHASRPTRLRAERQRLGLSVRVVAQAVGYDPSNLSRLELGRQTPPRDVARALHRFYEGRVSLADVYDPKFRCSCETCQATRAAAATEPQA